MNIVQALNLESLALPSHISQVDHAAQKQPDQHLQVQVDQFDDNLQKLLITVAVLCLFFLTNRLSAQRIRQSADDSNYKTDVVPGALRIIRSGIGLLGALALAVVWGVNLQSTVIFATTTLTLLGVALFASWSMLSNITAYFMLLMQPTLKRGVFVRVLEADNYIEGYVSDLRIFHTKLLTEKREVILYPNNLLFSRPVIVDPKDRLNGVGKIVTLPKTEPADNSG